MTLKQKLEKIDREYEELKSERKKLRQRVDNINRKASAKKKLQIGDIAEKVLGDRYQAENAIEEFERLLMLGVTLDDKIRVPALSSDVLAKALNIYEVRDSDLNKPISKILATRVVFDSIVKIAEKAR